MRRSFAALSMVRMWSLVRFRLGGDVLLTDENGVSDISGADFAQAFVDEIETPTHTG
ncbi:hypothetical protein [uncultured Actinomyces sp.]|uniref:hypothetical protein n=1 Tax=uncultured Actinomyces sp. TaxID=249061 RepID=UPI0025EF8829|nr:hypothetical protein [uncultured Actinomyces sp.]